MTKLKENHEDINIRRVVIDSHIKLRLFLLLLLFLLFLRLDLAVLSKLSIIFLVITGGMIVLVLLLTLQCF